MKLQKQWTSYRTGKDAVKIELEYTTTFTYFDKMQRLAMAFAQAGRYVNIGNDGSNYVLEVFVQVQE